MKGKVWQMIRMSRARLPLLGCCLALAALALGGCRSEEQGRALQFEKGTYLGEPDQTLTNEQIDELRHRAMRQQ